MSRNMFCFFFVLGVTVGSAFGKTLDYTKNNNEGSDMYDETENDGIIGGHSVDIKQHPYQVAVLVFQGIFHCGGSIISEKYVLTAAHCCEADPIIYSVRIGSTYNSKDGTVYRVLNHVKHPKYTNNLVTVDFDVALMQTPPMKLDGVTSKAVQLADSQSSLMPGQNTIVTGWGDMVPPNVTNTLYSDGILKNGGSVDLQAVTVPVVLLEDYKKAYTAFNITVTDSVVCAGLKEGGKDACQGDSGGPLVAEGSLVQYGIVSFGYGCALPNVPGVYAYIPRARDWIKEISGI